MTSSKQVWCLCPALCLVHHLRHQSQYWSQLWGTNDSSVKPGFSGSGFVGAAGWKFKRLCNSTQILCSNSKRSALLSCLKSALTSMNRSHPRLRKINLKISRGPTHTNPWNEKCRYKRIGISNEIRLLDLCCVIHAQGLMQSRHQLYHNKKHNWKAEVSKSLEVNLLLLFSSQQVRKKNFC